MKCQGWLCSHSQPNPALVVGFGVPGRAQSAGKGRTCPRSDSGSQCGSSSGGRTAGVAEGHRLQDQHLPSARSSPLPQIPGVSPHTWVGVRVTEGAKKEPEAAAAEPGEPFYCTAKQGTSPSSVPRSREEPQSSAQPSKQDHRAAGNGGLGQEEAPWCPLCSSHRLCSRSLGRPKSQTAQTGWMRQQRPHVVSENRAQLRRAALLPMEHSSLHPTFKESLFQELTEPRVNFDPLGKQRKG